MSGTPIARGREEDHTCGGLWNNTEYAPVVRYVVVLSVVVVIVTEEGKRSSTVSCSSVSISEEPIQV